MPDQITEACVGCLLCKRYCPVNAISGERKQLHVINPRLCIECDICGRVCAFGAVQDRDGEVIAHVKPAQWPLPVWDLKACVACNICIQACPTSVISSQFLHQSTDKHRYPYLTNAKGCIGCSFCETSCPVDAITMQAP